MLLTISTTSRPATDLGFLLYKHPDRVQEFGQSFGTARVFYPEASEDRCTAALLLEIDPIALVRSSKRTRGSGADDSLGHYVNDRPYAASSLLAVAIGDLFRTARAGRCNARPELAASPIPLEIRLPALPCRGGGDIARRLFEPLGWQVEAVAVPLDEDFPAWGDSRYVRLTLRGEIRLADAINQLYVLLPVLDDAKHYWVADDEVDKLIRAGSGWLSVHPEKALITRRYLGRRWALARTAFARLAELGDDVEEALEPPVEEDLTASTGEDSQANDLVCDHGEDPPAAASGAGEADGTEAADGIGVGGAETDQIGETDPIGESDQTRETDGTGEPSEAGGIEAPDHMERRRPLNVMRKEAVVAALEEIGARRVIDLGCGSGQLLSALLAKPVFAKVTGVDVSARALTLAARKLKLDRMPDAKRARLDLFQGALTYTDARFAGYDAAVLMEVVEHVDPPRLPALERVVFGTAKPPHVIVTTPNSEYNVRYEFLEGSGSPNAVPARRHPDHRFEWTRAEFTEWTAGVCGRYGYRVTLSPVGEDDPELGPPTQMAVFTVVGAAGPVVGGDMRDQREAVGDV